MKVGLAQVDTRLGDFATNRRVVLDAWAAARARGAELVVFPELVVTGYPPRDLLFDPGFVAAALAATEELARATAGGPPLVVGSIAPSASRLPGRPGLHNVAALLRDGAVVARQAKRLLPSYDVFHETRWFEPDGGGRPEVPPVAGTALGLLVCEDMWDEGYPRHPAAELRAAGASLIACISAAPFRPGIVEERLAGAHRTGLPLVYVNAVGANDECVFDGGSFALDASGTVRARLPRFAEAVEVVDLAAGGTLAPEPGPEEALFLALVTGVRGFARKNGLRRAFLGLSGGVDSALVACIASEALGAAAVTAVALPSRHSDPRSTADAETLARRLGIGFEVVPIEPLHGAADGCLPALLDGEAGATADENLQARLRALVLMAFVNRRGGLLLNTSNKTELALGYGTLYGDMAGALAVIGDLTKTEVYTLARWLDARGPAFPPFILERPPSAELRPGQVDPFDYPKMVPLVEALLRNQPPPPGNDPGEVERCRRLIRAAEHKRWQAGIVLRVSDRAFGSGRLVPVTRA